MSGLFFLPISGVRRWCDFTQSLLELQGESKAVFCDTVRAEGPIQCAADANKTTFV
jgi:hypothetical protein